MKLQVSFDMIDLERALGIAQEIEPYADSFEVGTLLLLRHGIEALQAFKKNFPSKLISADSKIVDRGRETALIFTSAKADWITVMAGTNRNVIHAACATAHEHGTKVMLDLIDSREFGQSALEAKNLGVDALLIHQPYDLDEPLVFLDKWELIRGNTDLPIHVSTRIKRDNIDSVVQVKPHGIILGRTITEAENPKEEARYFSELIKKIQE